MQKRVSSYITRMTEVVGKRNGISMLGMISHTIQVFCRHPTNVFEKSSLILLHSSKMFIWQKMHPIMIHLLHENSMLCDWHLRDSWYKSLMSTIGEGDTNFKLLFEFLYSNRYFYFILFIYFQYVQRNIQITNGLMLR